MSNKPSRKRFSPTSMPALMGAAALAGTVLLASFVSSAAPARAADATVALGTASTYSVIGSSTVTNAGASVLSGDLGLSPGTSVTGFPPGKISGTMHANDEAAAAAHDDLTTAYNDAASRTPNQTVGKELGGLTLAPGVYNSPTTFGITGTLTLDGQNSSSAVFIFQAGSTLITAGGSSVNLINGARPSNVFWQVGSSATLGANSNIVGTVMAAQSDTVGAGAKILGRVMALGAAVTLSNNAFSDPGPTTASTLP